MNASTLENPRHVSATAYLTVFALTVCVILIRSLDTFLHPIAGWEDATQGIDVYVHAGSNLFHAYAGYISALPNIVDDLAVTMLPLAWVPYAQAWFALALAASVAPATLGFFCHVTDWPVRIAAPAGFCIACLPLGDVAAVSNTEFSIWSMLAVLLLSLANPVPRRPACAAAYVAWRLLFATSIPLSIVAVPVWLILAVIHRREILAALAYLLLSCITLAYVAWFTTHESLLTLTLRQIAGILAAALRLATEKSLLAVTLRGILGINVHAPPIWVLTIVFCTATTLLCCAHLAGRPDRRRALLEIGLPLFGLIAVAFLCALGRGAQDSNFVLDSPRYHYLPKFLWIVAIAIAGVDIWRWQIRSKWRKPVVAFTLSVCFLLLWQRGIKNYRSNNAQQSNDIENFLAHADAMATHSSTAIPRYSRLAPDGDWSIFIDRQPSR